jgi:hypothetical protein
VADVRLPRVRPTAGHSHLTRVELAAITSCFTRARDYQNVAPSAPLTNVGALWLRTRRSHIGCSVLEEVGPRLSRARDYQIAPCFANHEGSRIKVRSPPCALCWTMEASVHDAFFRLSRLLGCAAAAGRRAGAATSQKTSSCSSCGISSACSHAWGAQTQSSCKRPIRPRLGSPRRRTDNSE